MTVKISPKSLILELFVAAGDTPLPVRIAVGAARLFGISENNVRVAFARLSSAGMIEAAGRGEYRLGEGATEFARDIASWRHAEARMRKWSGNYVMVHTGALGRTDRSALRRRMRATNILGFGELSRGLYARPDNLAGGVSAVRARLHALGLDDEASVFVAADLGERLEKRARALWDGRALSASYRRTERQIDRWLEHAPELEPDVAARESFLLGGAAIRQIVYDPLLPEELVDVEARRAFFDSVRRMDREGRRIWKRFFEFAQLYGPEGGAAERMARASKTGTDG